MNKKPLLQVDSSKVSGIHKLYEDNKSLQIPSNSWRKDKKFQENPVFSS
jgi:hypothetical protein